MCVDLKRKAGTGVTRIALRSSPFGKFNTSDGAITVDEVTTTSIEGTFSAASFDLISQQPADPMTPAATLEPVRDGQFRCQLTTPAVSGCFD